jgi:hypothetical protein
MHRHSAGQAERQPERESRRPWSRYAHLSIFIPIPPHPPRQPCPTSPIIIGLVVSSKFLGRSGRSVIFDSFDQSDKTDLAESIVDSYGHLNPETPFMTLLMPRRNDAGSMGFGAIKDSFTPTTLDGSNGGKGVTIDLRNCLVRKGFGGWRSIGSSDGSSMEERSYSRKASLSLVGRRI